MSSALPVDTSTFRRCPARAYSDWMMADVAWGIHLQSRGVRRGGKGRVVSETVCEGCLAVGVAVGSMRGRRR